MDIVVDEDDDDDDDIVWSLLFEELDKGKEEVRICVCISCSNDNTCRILVVVVIVFLGDRATDKKLSLFVESNDSSTIQLELLIV